MSKLYDNVNSPQHYAGSTSLECIDVMRLILGRKAVYYFCLCNAFKYMWRYKNKNGEEDLKKADWYLSYISKDIKGKARKDMSRTEIKVWKKYLPLRSLLDRLQKTIERVS